MLYGKTFLPDEYKSDNIVTESISIIFDEFCNRLSLLESCTESEKPLLEAQVQVLYEISIEDIKNKIHDIIDFIKRKWREFCDWVKKIWNKIWHNEDEANKVAFKVEKDVKKQTKNMFEDEKEEDTFFSASKAAKISEVLKTLKVPLYDIAFKAGRFSDKNKEDSKLLVSGGNILYCLKQGLDGDINFNDLLKKMGASENIVKDDFWMDSLDKDINDIIVFIDKIKNNDYNFKDDENELEKIKSNVRQAHYGSDAKNKHYEIDKSIENLYASRITNLSLKNYTIDDFSKSILKENNSAFLKKYLNEFRSILVRFEDNPESLREIINTIFAYQGEFKKDVDDLNKYNDEIKKRISKLDKCVKDLNTVERNLSKLFDQTKQALKNNADKYGKSEADSTNNIIKDIYNKELSKKEYHREYKNSYKDYIKDEGLGGIWGNRYKEYSKDYYYYETDYIKSAIKSLNILSKKIQGSILNLRRTSSMIIKCKNESVTAINIISSSMAKLLKAEYSDKDPNEI